MNGIAIHLTQNLKRPTKQLAGLFNRPRLFLSALSHSIRAYGSVFISLSAMRSFSS
jgi:hypothetical protein